MLTFIQDGVPKLRAGDSDVKQPNLPNGASEQLMRSPWGFSRGAEQAMKSTCLEHEEVRRGRQGKARGGGCQPAFASKNPAGLWNVQTAVSLSNCSSWHDQLWCILPEGFGAFWVAAVLIDAPPWQRGRVSAHPPHSKDLSAISQVGKGAKADAVKGRVAQCTHGWQEPKIENQSNGSSGSQTWKRDAITMKVSTSFCTLGK